MGVIFISHSSRDNDDAVKIRAWLKEAGYPEVFLDLDPAAGLAPGQKWQEELRRAGENCSAVLVLLSPDWAKSTWCIAEFLLAFQLGKKIFPVIIKPTDMSVLPAELTAHWQIADLSSQSGRQDGLERLRIGLKRAGLDPSDFPWPPPHDPSRGPYRGLATYETEDAAVFFGRSTAITRALDAIRRMAGDAPERALVILGASGAGKSSFLRAGLLARLERDSENCLVAPMTRPGNAACSGAEGLLAALGLSWPYTAEDIAARFDAMRAPVIAHFGRLGATASVCPTIVFPIDQAEELFGADQAETREALQLIADIAAADRQTCFILTIRTDSFAHLQSSSIVVDQSLHVAPFNLSPVPTFAFNELIERPGQLANPRIVFDPELTERLVADMMGQDALPLMAFALERLASASTGRGAIGLKQYEQMGGLSGVVRDAVDAAMRAALSDPDLPNDVAAIHDMVRRAFIPWLVRIDDISGVPKRRVAKWSEISKETAPVLRRFVHERLLVSSMDHAGNAIVEVMHEAVLRQWPDLSKWIDEERVILRQVDVIRTDAAEWDERRRQGLGAAQLRDWLNHRGGRLLEAERIASEAGYGELIGQIGLQYLAACRGADPRPLADAVRDPASLADHLHPSIGPKRILSLDGGGVRCIFGLGVLRELEQELRRRSGDPRLVLSDYFDLIGGTSLNGLVAAALALGMSVDDVHALVRQVLPGVFARTTSAGLLREVFDLKTVERALDPVLGRATLGSSRLRTGLALHLTRIDTGSPWVLTNNPRSLWYDAPGRESNKDYRLSDLVRACIATPHYFDVARIVLHRDEKGSTLSEGIFVDGAISGFNNPSVQLLLTALVPQYGFGWKAGEDKLMMVSVGNGEQRPRADIQTFSSKTAVARTIHLLRSASVHQQLQAVLLMQAISNSAMPWRINSEVGDLDGACITSEPMLDFQRIDVQASGNDREVEILLGRALDKKTRAGLDEPTNVSPANMDLLMEIGRKAGAHFVNERSPRAAFDFNGWRERQRGPDG